MWLHRDTQIQEFLRVDNPHGRRDPDRISNEILHCMTDSISNFLTGTFLSFLYNKVPFILNFPDDCTRHERIIIRSQYFQFFWLLYLLYHETLSNILKNYFVPFIISLFLMADRFRMEGLTPHRPQFSLQDRGFVMSS